MECDSVQYEYADSPADQNDGQSGGQTAQYVRLTDVIYPAPPGSSSGRDVQYGYGQTAGTPTFAQTVDDIMSRLATISESNGTVDAAYTYLGAGTIASEDLQQPQIELDYSADNFAALDRFGNILDQVWSSYGSASGGSSTSPVTLDGETYTYDQSGNRTSDENLTDAALSELYGYDSLDRLTSAERGTVSGGALEGEASSTETWTLDSLGNFTDSTDNSSTQTRAVDPANELQTITTDGTTASPTYDAAGNMTSDGTETYVYDAWNRLVKAIAESSDQTQNTLSGTFAQAPTEGTITATISGQVEYTDTNFAWSSLNWSDDDTAVTMVVRPMTGCAPTHLTMGYGIYGGGWATDDFAVNLCPSRWRRVSHRGESTSMSVRKERGPRSVAKPLG